jgi:beta-lactamase superfamily II metal-dependent hydrolase
LVCSALVFAWLGGSAAAATVSGDLRVFVLNVGQGDAILIVCPQGTHRMLIDMGPTGAGLQAFQQQMRGLLPGPSPVIQVVVVSHPHKDHVGGLEWVLNNFTVKKLIDNGHPLTTSFATATKAINSQKKKGTLKHFRAKQLPPKNVVDFCTATNLKAELLTPQGFGNAHDQNNNSASVLVTYNSKKLLFTGDAMRAAEKQLLADPATRARLGDVAFYKIGHHGAETSTTPDFLAAIDPSMAGASAGCKTVHPNSGYRHPRAKVLEALDQRIGGQGDARTLQAGETASGQWKSVTINRGVYATPVDDTFVIVTDGHTISKQAVNVAGAMGACPSQ